MLKEDKLVRLIADACLEEKAIDVVVLDVKELTIITDYFVIAGGKSVIQVKSIADNVEKKLKENGILPIRKEGYQHGVWVVLDYNSTILHIFRQEEREYYELENLWGDAREIEVQKAE
ncbi:MAG: ribosome silencing factor [Syntrophomonadaceae bacterium]|nr:ribosome silencing factor [Syntrophomonadaceae bacterium]